MNRQAAKAKRIEKKAKKRVAKVGKKALPAPTSTNTSFKFKPIGMPTQKSVNEEKAGVAVTHRHLSLDDLLMQIKHYSPNVRKGECSIHSARHQAMPLTTY